MKKFALLAIMALLVACTSNLDKINGKWACDSVATMALADEKTRNEMTANPLLGGMLHSFLQGMSLNVDATGKKMTIAIGKQQETGDFTVGSEGGDKITLKAKGGSVDIVIKDKDTLHISGVGGNPDQLKVIVFRRAQ